MKEHWKLLNSRGSLKRRPYFFAFSGIVLLWIPGGYLLREVLLTKEYVSSFYLEITFAWELLILGVITPFSVWRSRDIGISGWWVLVFWLLPFFDLNFMYILSKYMGLVVSGGVLWPALFLDLIAIVLIATLLFSKSKNEENN
ncbi:hypothetical protein [Thiolapillus sp.]